MIIKEFYKKRSDGVNLYSYYSDKGLYIKKEGSIINYEKIIQTENSTDTYTESEIKIIKHPRNKEIEERIRHDKKNK